ncbi:MAG TPA: matrixin family metalloprotease [Candidatus Nitrosotenuis sp.]|nr:matrixin family metalloprotease [Candidatus Nitrosotenuis sp.]
MSRLRAGLVNFGTRPENLAIVVSALILLGISSAPHAKAETVTIYVEKMPQHWQGQFGDVLSNATKYWEGKRPNLKFDTVDHVDKADFVVEWASQYEDGKLGYYSASTDNAYGKPTVAVTLGFFKGKEWRLASADQITEIAKHELGHAIGLPYSTDPNDIMYPTVEDIESWQQDPEYAQTTGSTADWQGSSEKYQSLAAEKVLPLAAKIGESQSLLDSASYEGMAAKDALNSAKTAFWWAKKYLDSSERLQADGGSFVLQSDYHTAYIKFKSSYEYAKKTEQKLTQIAEFIEKANSLAYTGN